ncbi:MAG: hypothetical protein IID37_01040 [Planctomycetes bacterium]|nr:hypothetical protein [Planctomycetota bacterium]
MTSLANIVYRTIAGAGGAASLGAFLLSNPLGWVPFGFIVGGVLGYEALAELQKRLAGRDRDKLDEYLTRVLKSLDGIKRAAETIRIEKDGELDLSGLDECDRSNPYIIFYRLLNEHFDSSEQAVARIDTVLRDHSDFARRVSAFMLRHIFEIKQQVGVMLEDINAIGDTLSRLDGTTSQLLQQTKHYPPLSTPVFIGTHASRFDYRTRQVPLFGRDREMAELAEFLGTRLGSSGGCGSGPEGLVRAA